MVIPYIYNHNINNHRGTYMQPFQYGFYIWFYIYIYIYFEHVLHIFLFLALLYMNLQLFLQLMYISYGCGVIKSNSYELAALPNFL